MKSSLTLHDLTPTQISKVMALVCSRAFGNDEAVISPETLGNVVSGNAQQDSQGNAYGFGNAPLPPGAIPALSSAAAAPSPTVPAAPPASSSAAPSVPPAPAPLPAPPAPAPTGSAAPSNPAAGAAVELDKHGLPWDHRIHTSTKSKNNDGSWRQKRGTDPAVISQVEGELRAALAAGGAVPPAPVGGVPPAPVAAHAELTGDAAVDFATIMDRLMKLVAAQKLTQDGINHMIAKHGVASIGHLSLSASLYPAILSDIKAAEA